MEDIAGLQNVQVPQGLEDMWHDRQLGLARLCIARCMKIEKAEKVLLLVITGDCNITGFNTVIHPATYSEVRLSALNTLGNMYEDKGSWAKAANIYRSSMLILQALDRPKPLWLGGSCENYVADLSPDLLQDSDLQSPAFLPQTQRILALLRKIKEADAVLRQAIEQSDQQKFGEAATMFDALRTRLPLPLPDERPDKRMMKVWKDVAACYVKLRDYGIARDIFEDVLPVAKMLEGAKRML
jgi:tetratricopeptide (TPR) repeat protein